MACISAGGLPAVSIREVLSAYLREYGRHLSCIKICISGMSDGKCNCFLCVAAKEK